MAIGAEHEILLRVGAGEGKSGDGLAAIHNVEHAVVVGQARRGCFDQIDRVDTG